jgi:hypothetical protein
VFSLPCPGSCDFCVDASTTMLVNKQAHILESIHIAASQYASQYMDTAREWEWLHGHRGSPSAAVETGGQGARAAAETGRLAPQASGGQEREEQRLFDVQTSQLTSSPRQSQPPPFAHHYRTLEASTAAGMAPSAPLPREKRLAN